MNVLIRVPRDPRDVAKWISRLDKAIVSPLGDHTSSGAEFVSIAEAVGR